MTWRSLIFLVLVLAACSDPVQVGGPAPAPAATGGPGPVGPAPQPNGTGPGQAVDDDEADAGVGEEEGPGNRYRDQDFIVADTNRDPFYNYAALFVERGQSVESTVSRNVIMSDTAVEEMRVIAIVTGMSNARAMIVDGEGVGHAVRRGDYIGRDEVVQAGGTEALAVHLNWRVERIRPSQVVISRDDPTAPNRPPLTRVLPLREEREQDPLGGVRVLDRPEMRIR